MECDVYAFSTFLCKKAEKRKKFDENFGKKQVFKFAPEHLSRVILIYIRYIIRDSIMFRVRQDRLTSVHQGASRKGPVGGKGGALVGGPTKRSGDRKTPKFG